MVKVGYDSDPSNHPHPLDQFGATAAVSPGPHGPQSEQKPHRPRAHGFNRGDERGSVEV